MCHRNAGPTLKALTRGAKDDIITSGSSSLSKWDDKKRIDRFGKSGPVSASVVSFHKADEHAHEGTFILDSVASHHICAAVRYLSSVENCRENLQMVDGSTALVRKRGQVNIFLRRTDMPAAWLQFENVLHAEGYMKIVSVSTTDRHGIVCTFGGSKYQIKHSEQDNLLGEAFIREDGLYELQGDIKWNGRKARIHLVKMNVSSCEKAVDLWHKRLGLAGHDTMKDMIAQDVIDEVKLMSA
jgi:hypothetical protein